VGSVSHGLDRAVGQVPLLLVGSARPGAGRDDLDRLRRGVLTRGGHVIELGPLTGAEVSELISGVQVPVSLDAAIAERLEGLTQDAVQMLRWAAVLGIEFSVTELQVVSGQSVGDLMGVICAALKAGVLAEAGTRLEFRHGLIRQMIYEGLPTALRAALHLQADRALATADAAAERIAAQLAQQAAVPDAEHDSSWAADWLCAQAAVLSRLRPSCSRAFWPGSLTMTIAARYSRPAWPPYRSCSCDPSRSSRRPGDWPSPPVTPAAPTHEPSPGKAGGSWSWMPSALPASSSAVSRSSQDGTTASQSCSARHRAQRSRCARTAASCDAVSPPST
jgi:hypothetical protein